MYLEKDGIFVYYEKIDNFVEDVGGIFQFIDSKDYATQIYQLNDYEYAQQNSWKKYQMKHEKWKIMHEKFNRNYNHPNHPGPEPMYKPPSAMDLIVYFDDRSGSIFHIQIDENCTRPVKNGVVLWNVDLNINNYLKYYFNQMQNLQRLKSGMK